MRAHAHRILVFQTFSIHETWQSLIVKGLSLSSCWVKLCSNTKQNPWSELLASRHQSKMVLVQPLWAYCRASTSDQRHRTLIQQELPRVKRPQSGSVLTYAWDTETLTRWCWWCQLFQLRAQAHYFLVAAIFPCCGRALYVRWTLLHKLQWVEYYIGS